MNQTPYDRVKLARSGGRPTGLDYIQQIFQGINEGRPFAGLFQQIPHTTEHAIKLGIIYIPVLSFVEKRLFYKIFFIKPIEV